MIISFSIKNFRSVKEKVTLSFEADKSDELSDYYVCEPVKGVRVLKLGLIYGPNGSGKTTILKGLDFLRELVLMSGLQKQDKLTFSPFLFDSHSQQSPSSFELAFIEDGVKYMYDLVFTQDAITEERLYTYSPNKSLVYERKTDLERQLAQIKFGSKIKIKKSLEESLEANTLWNGTVLNGFARTNIDLPELRAVMNWFVRVLRGLVTPKTDLRHFVQSGLEKESINKENVIQFLKKADFRINGIQLEKRTVPYTEEMMELMSLLNRQMLAKDPKIKPIGDKDFQETTEIHFEHQVNNVSYSLPYTEESEGTQRYFQFSGLLDLMLNSKKVVLIDELESSLHPDLLKHFLLLFLVNVKNSQLIATTHYRELLLERDILRDDAIWFTEKQIDGSMDLFSLSDFDSSVVRDTTSVFNAYRSGKLGAVPELSDYYLNLEDGKE